MVAAKTLRVYLFVLAALTAAYSPFALAQGQPVAGMIARKQTDLLTYEDKLAAYDAEQAVLSSDWGTGSDAHNWTGPNGAYGTIIAGGPFPQPNSKAQCRRFIHIVHHTNDGGKNPTYHGMACRATPDARWEPDR